MQRTSVKKEVDNWDEGSGAACLPSHSASTWSRRGCAWAAKHVGASRSHSIQIRPSLGRLACSSGFCLVLDVKNSAKEPNTPMGQSHKDTQSPTSHYLFDSVIDTTG